MEQFLGAAPIVWKIVPIILRILNRLSPAKVAKAFREIGVNMGVTISPQEAFEILEALDSDTLKRQLMALTGNHLQLEKAINNNDMTGFVTLCEQAPNASDFLAACAGLKIYLNAKESYAHAEECTPEETEKLWDTVFSMAFTNDLSMEKDPTEEFYTIIAANKEFFELVSKDDEKAVLQQSLEELKSFPRYAAAIQQASEHRAVQQADIFTKKVQNEQKSQEITAALRASYESRRDKTRAFVAELKSWQKEGYIDPHFNAKVMYDSLSQILPLPFGYDTFKKYYNGTRK